jgi:hypothetical protein
MSNASVTIVSGAGSTWTVSHPMAINSAASPATFASGSTTMTVASATGLHVNDYIVVETGGESGGGTLGTVGVGGTWPAKTYATTAALLADTSQVNQLFAWPQDSGFLYQWTQVPVTSGTCSGTTVTLTVNQSGNLLGAGPGSTLHVSGLTGTGIGPLNGTFVSPLGSPISTLRNQVAYTVGSCSGVTINSGAGTVSTWTKPASNIVPGPSSCTGPGNVSLILNSPIPIASGNVARVYFTGSSLVDGNHTTTTGTGGTAVNYNIGTCAGVSITGGQVMNFQNSLPAAGWYMSYAVPMGLTARITQISGTTLTLDTAAATSTTNANVYFDNTLIVNNLAQTARGTCPGTTCYSNITPSMTLIFPAGTYWFSNQIIASNWPNWQIWGQGSTSTFLKSPKSVRGFKLLAQHSTNMIVQNFAMTGNMGDVGYAMAWPYFLPGNAFGLSTEYDWTGKIVINWINDGVTQTANNASIDYGGVRLLSDNAQGINIVGTNIFNNTFTCQYATSCSGTNITANVTVTERSYVQWQVGAANMTNFTCTNCTVNGGPNMVSGFLNFRSTGTQWISPTGNNAGMESNTSDGWISINANFTLNNGGGPISGAWSLGQGIVQIDTNAGSGYNSAPITINNMTLTVTGVLDVNNNLENAILISNTMQAPITINGLTHISPNYAGGPALAPAAIRTNSATTATVTASHVSACAIPYGPPYTINSDSIGIANGSVNNSSAYNICLGATCRGTGGCGANGNVCPCP